MYVACSGLQPQIGSHHVCQPVECLQQHLRAELRNLYGKLCRDDTPMVRRAAAFRLGKFADTVEIDVISKEIIPLFQDLTQDGKLATQWRLA